PVIAAAKTRAPRHFPLKTVLGASLVLVLAATGVWRLFPRRPFGCARRARAAHHAAAPQVHPPGLPGAGVESTPPSPTEAAPSGPSAPEPAPGVNLPQTEAKTAAKGVKEERKAAPPKDLVLFVGSNRPNEIAVRCDGVEKVKRELAAFE